MPLKGPDGLPPAPVLPRVARGELDAVQQCLTQYGGLVWSLARRYSPAEAEDAVQEIFVDLWKNAGRFDPAIASEVAFITMLARRRLIDRVRSATRRPQLSNPAPALAPEHRDPGASPERCAEAAQALRALHALRDEQREVLLLSTCHGLSHGEIAEQIGMPLGTVKAHARRGLLQVRAALLGAKEALP
ncbi:MAG TPA: sigma-70 family RNA polymerase sigma factor [Pseudomonadota bacterium]|nr:sigma-70 family RNA polymerase sigma factor [Pseudomonadota bacterium]